MTDSNKLYAALFASLVVVSMVGVAAVVAAPAAGTSAGPSGMLALGDEQVTEDLPDDADAPIGVEDLRGNVYASEHAGSMEVVLTTPERAEEHLGDSGNVVSDSELAIVVSDAEHHDGREVAVDAGVLEDALGHQPGMVAGAHSSGDEWTRSVEYEAGNAVFEIPRFSSNAVTFGGGITLEGDAAGDGTQYQYELDDLDGIDDFAINVTGVTNSEEAVLSGSVDDGHRTESIGGNTDPLGVDSNTPEITVTSVDSEYGLFEAQEYAGVSNLFGDGSSEEFDPENAKLEVTRDAPEQIDKILLGSGPEGVEHNSDADDELTINVYLDNGGVDGDVTAGTLVATTTFSESKDVLEIDLDEPFEPSGNAVSVGFEVTDSSNPDSRMMARLEQYDYGEEVAWVDGVSLYEDYMFDVKVAEDGASTVDITTSSESVTISDLDGGQSGSESLSLSAGDEVELSGDGVFEYDLPLTLQTRTSDPVVELNGYTTEYEGTLSDGETVSLATNDAWIEEGTNTVNVTTNSPETGPESLVGFEYAHDASSVTAASSVEATTWSETIVANNTFPSAVSDATVTVPVHDRVTDIRELTVEVDGNETAADHTLDGTDVTIELGDVDAGTEVSVEVVGSKVQTHHGEIEVTEPTVEGDVLDSEIEVTSLDDGESPFGISVGGTAVGERIHYTTDESWSGEDSYVEVTSDVSQIVRAPGVNEGSTFRVASSGLEVVPESGAMEVTVDDADEPRFSLREGDTIGASSVDVTWHDTTPGDRYVLWSETEDREVDADRASSPVHFTTDGSSETYSVRQIDREGSVAAGSAPASGAGAAPMVLVLPAVAISVSGLFWAGRRFGDAAGVRGNALLLIGSAIVSVAALELVTPGSMLATMFQAVVFALGDAAASGIGAVIASVLTLAGVWQLNERTRADVPWWVIGPTVFFVGIVSLEAIRPGSVLGALEEVLVEVGALLALLAVGVAVWRWRQRDETAAEEASTPDTQLTLDLGESTEETDD